MNCISYADVNGSVLHVVERPPPSTLSATSTTTSGSTSQSYMQASFSLSDQLRDPGNVEVCNKAMFLFVSFS